MELQNTLFNIIKEQAPPSMALADEVAELLNVSTDSVYRRMRGETALTLDEAHILCDRFGMSLDQILGSKSDSVTFKYRSLSPGNIDFKTYLTRIKEDMEGYASHDIHEMIYSAKDVPIFYLFHFPALAAFKTFFWLKSFMVLPEFKDMKFSMENANTEIIELGKEIAGLYAKMPSTEIWNDESLNSAIQQVHFIAETGQFENRKDALYLCDQMEALLDLVKDQANRGGKRVSAESDGLLDSEYKLYNNDLTLVDNLILIKMDDKRTVYITHNLLNNLITSNKDFGDETDRVLQNIMNKASMISSTNARDREKFFNRLNAKVDKLRDRLNDI